MKEVVFVEEISTLVGPSGREYPGAVTVVAITEHLAGIARIRASSSTFPEYKASVALDADALLDRLSYYLVAAAA